MCQLKLMPKVPFTHQTSVIDRILTDQHMLSHMRQLKRLNYMGIALSVFAVINVMGKMLDQIMWCRRAEREILGNAIGLISCAGAAAIE